MCRDGESDDRMVGRESPQEYGRLKVCLMINVGNKNVES